MRKFGGGQVGWISCMERGDRGEQEIRGVEISTE
jgi:hypothetical protein